MIKFLKAIACFIMVQIYLRKSNTEVEIIRIGNRATIEALTRFYTIRHRNFSKMYAVYDEKVMHDREFVKEIDELRQSQKKLADEIDRLKVITNCEGINKYTYFTIKHTWREVSLILGSYPDDFPALYKTRWFDVTLPLRVLMVDIAWPEFRRSAIFLWQTIIFIVIAINLYIFSTPLHALSMIPAILLAMYMCYRALPKLYDISDIRFESNDQRLKYLNLEGITAKDKWLNSNTVTSTTNSTSN